MICIILAISTFLFLNKKETNLKKPIKMYHIIFTGEIENHKKEIHVKEGALILDLIYDCHLLVTADRKKIEHVYKGKKVYKDQIINVYKIS